MSARLHKTPKIIQQIDKLNNVIIKQSLTLENKETLGTYILRYDGTDTEDVISVIESNCTFTSGEFMCLKADDGMILLVAERKSSRCVGDIVKFRSPAGLEIGSMRKRRFTLNSHYDICGGNMNMLFHFKSDSSGTAIKTVRDDVVATVSNNTENTSVHINYKSKTSVIEKMLILTSVLAWRKNEHLYRGKLSGCCQFCLKQLTVLLIFCLLCPIVVPFYVLGVLCWISMFPILLTTDKDKAKSEMIIALIWPWTCFCVCSCCRGVQDYNECDCFHQMWDDNSS